ncbi:MAG: large repetitive protein [Thermoplasmata archaeon]|jgi:hypothetical protein|nr:large repetitive protein [Thermoplasmata archaeon]
MRVVQMHNQSPLLRSALLLAVGLAAVAAVAAFALLADEADAAAPCGPGACYSVSDGSPQNYRWIDMLDLSGRPKPSYNWVEIAPGGSPGGGNAVPGVRSGACGPAAPANCIDDDQYSSTAAGTPTCIGLGFTFQYYGAGYNCAWISDNGFLMLDNSPGTLVSGTMAAGVCYPDCTYAPAAFPTSLGPDRVIASYWADQNPFFCGWTGTAAAWGAFSRTVSSSGVTMFVVEWSGTLALPNAPWTSGCPGAIAGTSDCNVSPGDPSGCIRVFHQVQLHKDTNNVEVMLKNVKTPAAPGFTTVAGLGIENGGGTNGLNYGYGASETYTNHAVRYFPNHAPVCPSALETSVYEDAVGVPLKLTATDPDGDTLTFAATSPTIRAATFTGPVGDTITYTPAADFYGNDLVSYTVKDVFGLASVATCELKVVVKPVNDAPRAGASLATLPAATVGNLYAKAGVITGIASGPSVPAPNELDEQGILAFEIVSTTPDIFASGPSLACVPGPLGCSSATLSFVADTPGTSDICVIIVDEGGTDTTIGDKWRGPLSGSAEAPVCMKVEAKSASTGGDPTPPPSACSGPLPTALIELTSPDVFAAGGSLSLRDDSTAVAPKTIKSRVWDFGDGLSATDATPVHTYKGPGAFVVRLTAFDNTGCAAFEETVVRVQSPAPTTGIASSGGGASGPLADAGADKVVREGATVELTGTANGYSATDVAYRWIQAYPVEPKLAVEGADTATLRFTAPALADVQQGEAYVFALQATDLRTGMVSPFDTVQVDVTARSARPIADAGPDATVVPGRDLQLDASRSSDPDGDALAFAWTQVAGPKVVLLSADGPKPKLTTPVGTTAAYLDFELSVSDGVFTARDTMRVWLQPEGTTPPAFLVQAIPGEPNAFRFQANTPGDAFAWDFGDGSTGKGAVVTHTYASPDAYKVKLTVVDDARATAPVERVVTASAPARVDAVGADVAAAAGMGPAWPWLAAAAGVVAATAAAFWLLRRRAAAAAAPAGEPATPGWPPAPPAE